MARDTPLEPLLGNTAAKFKPEAFTWLGTSSRYDGDAFCLVIRPDTSVTGIEDLQRPGRPLVFAGQAAGASETAIALIARAVSKVTRRLSRAQGSRARTIPAPPC